MNTSRISFKQVLRGKWLFFTLGIVFAVTSSIQAAVLFSDNFDSYANGTADASYKTNYAGASGAPTFVITNGGLSGSKSFQATGDGTLIRTNVPINLAAGPVNIDIYFQRGTAGQAASPQIGVMTNVTGALNTSESVGGRFNNLEALDVRSTAGGTQSSVGTAPSATLITGNWYFLRGIITSNAAANSLTVVLQLFNSDSAGVVGTGIVTNTQTFNNASVYAAAAKLYAAVRLSGNTGVTNMDNFSVSQATTSPTITLTGTLGAVNTIVGTASPTPTSFTVSGVNLTGAPGNLTVTPPSGFEISLSSGSGYSTSLSVPYSSSTLAGTTVYVRLAATTAVGTYSGNITVAGGGATSQTITTASSTVGAAPPAITLSGTLGAVNTTYGTASASPTSFQISGSNLTGSPGNLTVSSPSGYEVSRTNSSGYSSSLSVSYGSSTLASTNIYVRLAATATVGTYSGNITVSGGGTNQTIATASSTVSKATPTVLVTVGSYTNNGSPQGPNTYTTIPSGDTGTATWSYVGVSGTTYGPSATPPTAAGYYTAQVTALTSDANFNSSSSSATAFSIANVNVLFTDTYTVSGSSFNIDFENNLGREGGSLSTLHYLTKYTGVSAYLQQLGNTAAFTNATYWNTNALLLFGDAGVRIDCDFSTVSAPLEIRFSAIVNWFGLANTNTLTVGNSSDGYSATNAAFAFQLHKDGTTAIYDHGVATVGTSGTNFGENILVDYKVILSDTNGTGSAFGSGGSKVTYYQSGTLLGTVTLSQLTAGQGYIGFVGGQGNVGVDNLQIASIAPGSLTLTGTLGTVNTVVGTASVTPTSFQISGSNLTSGAGNLTVIPPAGYEISLTNNMGYNTNLLVAYSGGTLASTTVYVRLAATTAVGSYFGNIIVSGGGDAKVIATAPSTVGKAASSVTYGGTASFTYNGTAQSPSITSITGSTGVCTTNYVGIGYASVNAPTNAGSYYISNTVASDANFNGVTNSLSFTISQATTAATLAVANTPVTYNGAGQSAIVSITSSNTPGSVTNILTGGAVTQTASGTYVITADYVPSNPNYTTLTGITVGSFVINKATVSVTLAVANTPMPYNGSAQSAVVTITASNTSGSVTNIQTGGATTQTVPGTYAVTANYTPTDTNYAALTGIAVGNFVITPAATFVGLTSTKNPAGYTDSVGFTAILPADATGSIFFSSTNGVFSTNTVSGTNTTSLSIATLPRGTNVITVAYLGDTNYFGSTNNLNQIVTNHLPVASAANYTRNAAVNQIKIAITNLLTNASDVDGDSLTLDSVSATTNNATILISGAYVLYENTNAVTDQFSYTVSDGFGGTNSATVTINIDSTPLFGQVTIPAVDTTAGTATLNFAGIPTYSYTVLRSTNLTSWVEIWTTNTPTGGAFQYIDLAAPQPSAYYQLRYNP